MVFNTTWPANATFPDNSTIPPNGTFPLWVIPPNPGRSLQPDIVACAVITFLISSAFVVLRFYTRGRLNHVLGASDWCILPALLCAAGVTASAIEQTVHGAGKHYWEIDPFKMLNFERAAWYGIFFYNLSLTLSRISILLLYKRIFTYSWIKRAIQIVLILVVAIGIWFIVSVCTACLPLEAFWDWSLYWKTPVYCQPVNLWWANAALHIVCDIVVMALPMPVLSSLNLPRRQKYAIIGVFALGFFVCVISIVRLITLITITNQQISDLMTFQPNDAVYNSANMLFWTTVEVNAAVACACIMTLKPFIQRVFPRLLSPSKNAREPSLQWITPVDNHSVCTTNHRNSNPSPFATSPVSPTPAVRRDSNTSLHHHTKTRFSRSGSGSASGSGSGSLPYLHEYEGGHHHRPDHDEVIEKSRYYHNFTVPSPGGNGGGGRDVEYDLDHDLDLEAQRTCSDFSVTAAAPGGAGSIEDEDDTPLDPAAALRAPPRAHLKLSIQVTGPGVGEKRSHGSIKTTTSGRRGGGNREGGGGGQEGEEVELQEGVGKARSANSN